jgi:hypothetical protein
LRQICGLKNVQVSGSVLPKLANEIKDIMGRDEWEGMSAVLKKTTLNMRIGVRWMRAGDLEGAFTFWCVAGFDIDRTRKGTSWTKLVERGGEPNKL